MPLSVDNCRLGDLFSLDSHLEFALHATRTMAPVEGKVVHRGGNGRLIGPGARLFHTTGPLPPSNLAQMPGHVVSRE
jgi:hypothetical protein